MTASTSDTRHPTPARTQFVRVCMDNQPANVRLFVMHGGVETFVELVGSAFQHAHSLTASSSSSGAAPLAITAAGADADANAATASGGGDGDGTGASPTGSSGSEEHFGLSASNGNRVPRRERASDLSVALTCRELVVECISCLSSALEVRRGAVALVGIQYIYEVHVVPYLQVCVCVCACVNGKVCLCVCRLLLGGTVAQRVCRQRRHVSIYASARVQV